MMEGRGWRYAPQPKQETERRDRNSQVDIGTENS